MRKVEKTAYMENKNTPGVGIRRYRTKTGEIREYPYSHIKGVPYHQYCRETKQRSRSKTQQSLTSKRSNSAELTNKQKLLIAELHARGASYRDLARLLNTTLYRIRQAVDENKAIIQHNP